MSEEKENNVMNNEETSIEDGEIINTVSVDKSRSGSLITYVVIIILLIAFSVAFVFINNRLIKIETDYEENKLSNNSVDHGINNRLNDVLSRFTNLQEKLEKLELKQEMLSHSFSQPIEQQMHINKDYALAEIEHLLIIASYNLELDHNVATALSAMETAETRLKGSTAPAVLSARKQLIADMNELRSLNQADLSGMALFVSDLISRVDDLVLKESVVMQEQEIATEKNKDRGEGVKHFFALVFNELKSLIVITRDKDVGKVRLLPDEIYFLRANLKLELANARFAIFNRDTDNLHQSINHIQNWLNSYFDLSDANVRNIYDSLSSMKKIELRFPELDISSSLESIRALSRYQDENNNETDKEFMPQQ